jgi:hypothetical protein
MKLKEIKRLLRIIEFFKETKNQTVQEAYYFVNVIDEEIKTKVEKYCKDINVYLVNKEDF